MFRRADKLEELRKAILGLFRNKEAPEVRLLGEGQMLIRKNMAPNPAAERGLKAATFRPAPDGYEIYVARRPAETTQDAPPPQRAGRPRPVAWDAKTMTVQVERDDLSTGWEILARDGQAVSISVECGPEGVVEEVNQILATCAKRLL